jgi:hypothetical protein
VQVRRLRRDRNDIPWIEIHIQSAEKLLTVSCFLTLIQDFIICTYLILIMPLRLTKKSRKHHLLMHVLILYRTNRE